ncbi:Peptidyl-tRNA hydrolase ArfB [Pirellulimonas nuda]|uniref:Peptidyl-tRNA hydrolase ArfB n=1 Tax=Pirellulimonas nuda TaxID=2528009 RepID=A0A518DA48_9BACT|nr:alternative ribosome rescue aminoacyl-tRNA hydrolase ArfB [Pirellulimonas nuda]QDU88361.1 Peptidyl-tRNA hydrolase ArfB [Pirellulimonas nuda]
MGDLVVNDQIVIPSGELRFTFARSSGPGGQNVNKVNSKAVLHWNVATTTALPPSVRTRMTRRFANRIDQQGELLLFGQRHREQGRNVRDCLDKLRAMVLSVAAPPTVRKATRPPAAARRARLEGKRIRSDRKQSRRPPSADD